MNIGGFFLGKIGDDKIYSDGCCDVYLYFDRVV